MDIRWFVGVVLLTCTVASQAATDLVLADQGEARCVIVVPRGAMTWEGDSATLDPIWGKHSEEPERRRRLQRDSIQDLSRYLGMITQTTVPIVEASSLPAGRVPIYVGSEAQRVFGPVGISKAGLYGFRVVINDKGVGLFGESEYGTSYAIYELLHRLGCRWFMPSEMGQCIPTQKNLTLSKTDESLAPATLWRRIEIRTADPDFRRRNRMGGSHEGGSAVFSHHALESYITQEQRDANPEWRLVVNGKPHPKLLRWTRQDVADAIADAIIAKLDKAYTPSVSLSPGDYVVPTDDPEEMKEDPSPRVWEPAANQWSVSDRLILLANRVAERVGKKYPDVRFGLLAYVNYSMPPAKHKVHPNVIPVLAPIDFNRQHPMTWPNHPNKTWLLDMLRGWAAMAPHLGYYAYGMNLAELSAPNPFITKWGTDLPIILSNHVDFWMPETMGGWESMMPAYVLSMRMSFDPTLKPEPILQDMYTRLYGSAAEPMSRYWNRMDRAWIDANEFSGCGFGYLRMFTPQIMQGAREDINEALKRCESITEYRRVKLIDESLSLFELFMKMRRDWAVGRLINLASDLDDWRGSVRHLRRVYKEQYVLGGLTLDYVDRFWGSAYEDASAVWKEFLPMSSAMVQWKYNPDPDKQAESLNWTAPNFDDSQWKSTHVVEETWSTLGHHNTMGRMVYRTIVKLNALPSGKKALLWIGSNDGIAKLYVNGKHVPYVVPEKTRKNEKGDVIEAFTGYCKPSRFDVTDVIKPGANQITIICERINLNELGTGGLMGPVYVFREK